MAVLRISQGLYSRLEAHAKGFDTPAQVIERILNAFESSNPSITTSLPETELIAKPTPKLSFYPNEEEFRLSLLNGHKNKVLIRYQDGTVCTKPWHTSRFSQSSNLRGNIWSGILRGWKSQDIIAAEFHVGDV